MIKKKIEKFDSIKINVHIRKYTTLERQGSNWWTMFVIHVWKTLVIAFLAHSLFFANITLILCPFKNGWLIWCHQLWATRCELRISGSKNCSMNMGVWSLFSLFFFFPSCLDIISRAAAAVLQQRNWGYSLKMVQQEEKG